MATFKVHHTTIYRYRQPVALGDHRMMLRPLESHDQRLLSERLVITPRPVSLTWTRDLFDNWVGLARFSGRASELRFDSTVRVAQFPSHPEGLGIEARARKPPVSLSADETAHLAASIEPAHADPDGDLAAWARQFLGNGKPSPTLDCLAEMASAIRRRFTYVRRVEKGVQPPLETLRSGSGTCRDFALLMMEAVRGFGLPARFVSGYLYVPSRDSIGLHGGGATHAWLQVYLPGAGWVDFDPTNGIVGNAGLIRVAIALEPRQALPLSGSYTGFRSDELGLEVVVKVACDGDAGMDQLRSGSVA